MNSLRWPTKFLPGQIKFPAPVKLETCAFAYSALELQREVTPGRAERPEIEKTPCQIRC
jgi:hypothetical protein